MVVLMCLLKCLVIYLKIDISSRYIFRLYSGFSMEINRWELYRLEIISCVLIISLIINSLCLVLILFINSGIIIYIINFIFDCMVFR